MWRGEVGGDMEQVLTTSSAAITTATQMQFVLNPNADFAVDDIWVVSDDLTTTATHTYDNANELLSMARTNNGTTTFAYDAWGRMTSKSLGGNSATYSYRYNELLQSITSSIPGEGAVTYAYRGDGSRYSQAVTGGSTTYYAMGGVNETDSGGTLTRT